jgi:hypothetical protein
MKLKGTAIISPRSYAEVVTGRTTSTEQGGRLNQAAIFHKKGSDQSLKPEGLQKDLMHCFVF